MSMTSDRRPWVRRIGAIVALLVFAGLVQVISTARSDSLAAEQAAAAIPQVPADADPSWHPLPTAEQDALYAQKTQIEAPFPGWAVQGRDGYWFLGDNYMANFAQAMGRRFYSQYEAQLTLDAVASRKSWLADQGIASEFFVIPATWSVYRDKMPEWADGNILPHILDQLISADPASFPDMRQTLIDARSVADTYPRLNSHWTPYGAYVGFGFIADTLGQEYPTLAGLPEPTLTGTTTVNDGNEFNSITGTTAENNWVLPQFAEPQPDFTVISTDGTRSTVPGNTVLSISQMPLQTENPQAGNDLKALVLADSATDALSPYLAGAFGHTMMVRHWMDVPEQSPNVMALVEAYHPDVVLTLLTERNLNVVTPDSETWHGSVAYDQADPEAVATWVEGTSADGTTVSSTDLSQPVDVQLGAVSGRSLALRLDMNADAFGFLTVSGTTAQGPFLKTLRIANGANVLFVQTPGPLTSGTLTIQRTAGGGAWTLTGLSARAETSS